MPSSTISLTLMSLTIDSGVKTRSSLSFYFAVCWQAEGLNSPCYSRHLWACSGKLTKKFVYETPTSRRRRWNVQLLRLFCAKLILILLYVSFLLNLSFAVSLLFLNPANLKSLRIKLCHTFGAVQIIAAFHSQLRPIANFRRLQANSTSSGLSQKGAISNTFFSSTPLFLHVTTAGKFHCRLLLCYRCRL